MNGELISVLAALGGVGGVAAAGLAGPVNHGWGPNPSALKQRLFMIGSDLPTRRRRIGGLLAVAGFLSGGAALSYAAAPARPVVLAPPTVQAVVTAPRPLIAIAGKTGLSPPGQTQAAALAPTAPTPWTDTSALIASPTSGAALQRPTNLDISRPLDATAIEYYYQRAIAENPTLAGARVGLTAEEARRLTALEAAQADYWAAQPAWSRRSFASYDDAVGVLGKTNADELLALQKKWKQAPVASDLDQLAALSPQDRQAEIDRRGAALAAKLSQRVVLPAASPQYATLSRDIADAQANLSDIQARYGITPRQP
ncbi:MAG: hypothetical protein JWM33_2038 [Caulobacteraceae bacterium]|nr:hypothetical protein [Caulobacteraceae bacterium]